MEAAVNPVETFDLDDTGKIDLTNIYDRLDPRQYYSTLGELEYLIPETAKPLFQSVISAYRTVHDQVKVRVVDVGCSYGVNAALLKCDLEMEQLYELYAPDRITNATREQLLARDRSLLERSIKDANLEVVGLDASRNAIQYGVEANFLDDGVAANLESDRPSPEVAAVLDDADLVISTGCIGYVGGSTMKRILEVNAPRKPWMVHFVLRMFPFGEIQDVLDGYGYVTEKVKDQTFLQRRFASDDEHEHVLERLAGLGVDPEGLEAEGWYHAEAYISRPAEACVGKPLAQIAGAKTGAVTAA